MGMVALILGCIVLVAYAWGLFGFESAVLTLLFLIIGAASNQAPSRRVETDE